MASTFQVQGPTALEWSTDDGSTYTQIGFSGNDQLFSVDIEYSNNIITATDTGEEPAEVVYTGAIAVLTCQLVKWDVAQVALIQVPPGGTGEGDAGVIGSRWVTGNHSFGIQFEPVTAGRDIYTFERCILNGPQAVQFSDFGNKEQVLTMQFLAFRDGGTNVIGDGSSATQALYTKTATV
jgi:hypothetical protein